jgi:hypothetical protein
MTSGERGLSEREGAIILSLRSHRLLTTRQVHEMHAPGYTVRWVRMLLGGLAGRGLVDRVRTRQRPPRAVWHLTARGLRAAGPPDRSGLRTALRWEAAAGPLQAHTLAVNNVGIAFMRAARAFGHDCGYLAWQHEVGHRYTEPAPGLRGGGILVADALVNYVVREPGRELFVSRFVELDRGTLPPQELQLKLRNYVRLFQYVPRASAGAMPLWKELYPTFPPVLVVFDGKPRSQLESRRDSILVLSGSDRRLRVAERPGMFFVLLEDLEADGPFAPVFIELGDPTIQVDVLGRPAAQPGALSASGA